jgi:hypothetical protein
LISHNWKEIFSFEYLEAEKKVSDHQLNDRGLAAEALLTDPHDYENIFHALPQIKSWIEPGAGYGIGPLLFAHLYPDKHSIGIELEKIRVDIGRQLQQRLSLINTQLIHADLASFELPLGDAYFFYFATGPVLDRMLFQLGNLSESFFIVVIESHGDLLPRFYKEKWLKVYKEVALHGPRHYPHAVIFKKIRGKDSNLHDLSFCQNYLLIEEDDGTRWIGDTFGLAWLKDDIYHLVHPPRSFREGQIKETLLWKDLELRWQLLIQLRSLGSINLITESSNYQDIIRKIYINPGLKVELTNGNQLDWDDIKKIYWGKDLCYDSGTGYFSLPLAVHM